ncbi:urease accessory protein UreD [Yoonia maricola]|uniref:urease accessory protein UreD n=1 Tax=Yoonia maricola TaxID=420999 RepID=UPI001FEA8DC4|nr:urease accessory protein UreD [Yoonia maricola]
MTINLPHHTSFTTTRPAQPRAVGEGALTVTSQPNGRTQIAQLRQAGSTKLVFPQNHSPTLEGIIVNTAGGITGGDRFTLTATAKRDTRLTLTTQAAERAYRAQTGEVGQVTTRLTVKAGAQLNWLPQELILFDHCALQRSLAIDLEVDARLLMVEPIVFGRTAMAEKLHHIRFHDRIRITRNGSPLYLDGMDIVGDAAAHMARPAIANAAKAMASLVWIDPAAASKRDALRKMLPPTAGASLIAPDVLVIRHLASDGFELRRALIPVLDDLTNNSLPISWRL